MKTAIAESLAPFRMLMAKHLTKHHEEGRFCFARCLRVQSVMRGEVLGGENGSNFGDRSMRGLASLLPYSGIRKR